MKVNSNIKHHYFKFFLSTAALAGMLLAQSGNEIVAKADKITVQPGDNLITLATKNNTTVDKLVSHNQITNPNHIEAGQVLDTDDNGQAITVIVKAGDTVGSLANEYGTTIQQIAQDNNLDENYTIIVGQQLKITTNNTVQVTPQQAPAQTPSVPTANNSDNQVANNQQTAPTTNNASNTQSSTPASPSTPATNQAYTSSATGNEASAKAWIASRESGGNYNATNGQYIGKYQLSSSYLNGDYSPANQERTADQYVQGRYGSWTAAQQFWQAHGWY